MIRYIRADEYGLYTRPAVWRSIMFSGRSLLDLRAKLAHVLREDVQGILLCARAGFNGNLTALVTDLPSNEEDMDIIILSIGSRAAARSRIPDVYAPHADPGQIDC
ncbi:hypothetical protein BS78_10G052600 [Paspalum vaginatum]|nr:hypothetical protein BS78_10G052600 [Paspalum vaginatum]